MANTSIKGKIVLEHLKECNPKIATRAIADRIYNSHKAKEIFKDYEEVRSLVRYYRGENGKKNRKDISKQNQIKKVHRPSQNPWAFIPESHSNPPDVWRLPKTIKKVLLISDIHIPYHDVEAIKSTLQFAKHETVDCIYINGDLLDFYQLSFHEKDRRKRPSMSDELEMCRTFLKGLRAAFPKAIIYFKPANHEHRLERYLVVKAPELLDCDEFRLEQLLRLREMKIEYIDRRTKTYFGHLLVEHGDRMKGSGGVNPARSLFGKYKRHVICGHFHRKSEHAEKIYDGKLISTFSVGALCELEPEYFEVNNHVNGFAIVEMNGDLFKVHNYTIEDGKVF